MRKLGCVFVWLMCIIGALLGVLCIIMYLVGTTLSTVGLRPEYASRIEHIWFGIEIFFYWLTLLPYFVVLLLMFIMSVFLWKAHYAKAKKLLKACAKILFVDSIIYLIGNVIMDYLGRNDFFTMYYACYVVSVMGFLGAFVFVCWAWRVGRKCEQIDEEF